ncbi:putative transposase [Parafrankia sp. EAN1pec]|nr:putative transposase [Frankia sp. EAN1pec]
MPAWPGRVDQQRGEPAHPPVDRDVINLEAAFGEESSSTSRYDRAYRRYQRTARMIIWGGNRNPANSDVGTGGRTRRLRIIRS